MNEVKFIVSYEIPINAWKQLTICVQQKTNIWYAKENKNRYGRLQVTICKAITKVGNRGIRESGNRGIGEYGNGRRYRYAVCGIFNNYHIQVYSQKIKGIPHGI